MRRGIWLALLLSFGLCVWALWSLWPIERAALLLYSGRFAEEWINESKAGRPNFKRLEAAGKTHQVEVVGEELRAMMPWISAGKTKVQEASGGQG